MAVASESRDLSLLRGELVTGHNAASSRAFARCQQLALSAPSERLDAHAREHLEGGAQLLSRIDPSALSPQPLAVEEVGASELQPITGASEPFDGFATEAVRDTAVAEQRARAGLEPEPPVGPAGTRALGKPRERALGEPAFSAPCRRLDELGHRPRRAHLVGGHDVDGFANR